APVAARAGALERDRTLPHLDVSAALAFRAGGLGGGIVSRTAARRTHLGPVNNDLRRHAADGIQQSDLQRHFRIQAGLRSGPFRAAEDVAEDVLEVGISYEAALRAGAR